MNINHTNIPYDLIKYLLSTICSIYIYLKDFKLYYCVQIITTRNAVIVKANRLGLPKHPSRLEYNDEIIYEENNNVEELYQPKICSHSTCTMTAQPGREYCAFHCRLIIEEQKKEKQAS